MPWALPVGLKCGPALLASTALQSPFSCTWKPWVLLAGRPPTSPVRCTPSAMGTRVILPLTRLPDAEARLATPCLAVLVAAGAAGCSAGFGLLPQAASATAVTVASSAVRMVIS